MIEGQTVATREVDWAGDRPGPVQGRRARRPAAAPHGRPKTSGDYGPILAHPSRVLFLDIETTGLSRFYDHLTVIGWEMDGEYAAWVAGDDASDFLEALAQARSIVTFNGSTFDLPFLAAAFGDLSWPPHHIDLRYACRRIGLTGGQKVIETTLSISCREEARDIDGAMAVLLWHRYLRGDAGALSSLIAYNRADVRAMAHILDHVVAQKLIGDLPGLQPHHAFAAAPDRRRGRGAPDATPPPPPVHLRPTVDFGAVFGGTAAENATVVGVDLTGSEKRPSGVCTLRGRHAETATMSTDDEIVALVAAAAPDLVSIDSPLCLPVGRTVVTDDDPNRASAGILRQSERTLKRRGINVYPCLLPSMQRLTARGIALAGRLRSLGVPVIECYPGAAQDIIGVPRKGAGLEFLTQGMVDFGIRGRFADGGATHDELDAVTCSMVGLFHLAGRSEGLGGDGEEPMIVPSLAADGALVVGVSGRMFAGKTTAARALERLGFAYTRISAVIEDEHRRRWPDQEPTRASMQELGLELHRTRGQRWLCARAIERAGSIYGRIVVDGLRWAEDSGYLRERFGGKFTHLHVRAPLAARTERARAAGREGELETSEAHEVESGIPALADLADATVDNDGTIAALERTIGRSFGRTNAG